MKKVLGITIILIMILAVIGQTNTVFALEDLNKYDPHQQPITTTEIKARTETVVAIIRNIGIVISVISLMIIGIREMTASAEEKSIIKQSMPGYILGVILVVAITILPSVIYQLVKGE